MSDRWVDELMPDQPMWVRDLVDEELRRKKASVERTARAFRACEQAREDAAALHRAEVERLRGGIAHLRSLYSQEPSEANEHALARAWESLLEEA